MDSCGYCTNEIKRTDKVIRCNIWCEKYFHVKCAKLSDEDCKFLSSRKNFGWFCDTCAEKRSQDVKKLLLGINETTAAWNIKMNKQDEKLNNQEILIAQILESVKNQKEEFKKELNQIMETQQVTYADKLKQKKYDPVIVIKPKDINQGSQETSSTIKKRINPIATAVTGIKKISKGGVVVECKDKEAVIKLKEEATAKLGKDYVVSIPKQKLPKIKIVGLNDKLDTIEMKNKVLAQNSFLDEKAYINIVHLAEDKKNRGCYFAYAEVDGDSYRKILNEQKLNIGWDRCRIYDAVNITRCFKCNQFGHKATDCKKETICPKCAGEHELSDCKSEDTETKCSNCVYAVNKLKMKIDIHHPAWSAECPVYKRRIEQERSKIDFLGHPQV